MDFDKFRRQGFGILNQISSLLRKSQNVSDNGRLSLPEAPHHSDEWETIINDVDNKVIPGLTQWKQPMLCRYFPMSTPYAILLGDLMTDSIGAISSSAATELETVVLNWLGRAIGLPNHMLDMNETSQGGGIIKLSTSECILLAMLASRNHAIEILKQQSPYVQEGVLLSKLTAYCSTQAHSFVEKAAKICFIKLRALEPNEKGCLSGVILLQAIKEDLDENLMPCFVCATLGTSSICAFDNLQEIGSICRLYPNIWLHVDAAYAGNAFICPELKPFLSGIEYAQSFNTNPNKLLLTTFDCSAMWVKEKSKLDSALSLNQLYFDNNSINNGDSGHLGVSLSRKFRAIKLWLVMRYYGITGLVNHIRHHIILARRFEEHVKKDKNFEVCNEVKLGLVCFRLKGPNKLTEKLLNDLNSSGTIYMMPSSFNDKYMIRFCIVSPNVTASDVDHAWELITTYGKIITEENPTNSPGEESMFTPRVTLITQHLNKILKENKKLKQNIRKLETEVQIQNGQLICFNEAQNILYKHFPRKEVEIIFRKKVYANSSSEHLI